MSKKDDLNSSDYSISAGSVFKIIFFVLLAIGLVALLSDSEPKTFKSLLEFLASAPTINIDWQIKPLIDLNFPSWLSVLEILVEFFSYLISFAWTFILSAWQALVYLFYIARWVFV